MATAPNPKEILVTEIGDKELGALDELTCEECSEWLRRLRWDYRQGAELIRQVAREGQLKGFVSWCDSRPVGYCFWVREGRKLLIGGIYVLPRYRDTAVASLMVERLLSAIDSRSRVERIESQNISFITDPVADLFRFFGYAQYDRYYMTRELNPGLGNSSGLLAPLLLTFKGTQFLIRPLEDRDFHGAAELIADSYVGRPDSLINSQYRSPAGCRDFLLNLMTSAGCGRYLPGGSLVVLEEGSREMAGVIVTSEVEDRCGHFPQLSTAPRYQGIGIGRAMIETAFRHLEASGFTSVSLAVTAINSIAVRLYEHLGFKRQLVFSTFVKERRR